MPQTRTNGDCARLVSPAAKGEEQLRRRRGLMETVSLLAAVTNSSPLAAGETKSSPSAAGETNLQTFNQHLVT